MAALAQTRSFVTAVVVTNGANSFLPVTLAALAGQVRPADRVIVLDASGQAASWQELGIEPVVAAPLPARPEPQGRPSWDEADDAAGAAYAGAPRSPLAPTAGSRAVNSPGPLAKAPPQERQGAQGEPQATGEHQAREHRLPLEQWQLLAVKSPNLATALESLAGEELGNWLWVLHADSAPAPTCLAELLRSALAATTVGMVGPKQIGWTQPQFLLSVGIRATASGRRSLDVEPGDIDQGQLDGRSDVLAVGSAGALLRVEAWRAVNGLDRHIGKYAEALEYGRRLWRARWRVIAAPDAVVHHARQSLRCVSAPDDKPAPQGSHAGRRLAQLHYWLSGCPLLWLLPSVLLLLPLSVFRAAWRLMVKQPRAALGELGAALLTLVRLPWIVSTRVRTAKVASTGAAVLKPLQVSTLHWAASHINLWRHRRVSKARAVAPSELEIAQQRSLTVRRRLALAFALVVSAAASAWLMVAVGLNPAGGAYASLAGSLADQLALARADLATGGTSLTPGAAPLALVVALLAAPLTLFMPLGQAVAVLHLSLPVVSVLAAWAAVGVGVRRVRVRLALSLVWATSPALLGAVAQGRTGAALAHATLPVAAFFLARAIGVNRLDRVARWRSGQASQSAVSYVHLHPRVVGMTAAAGAGMALAVLWAAAPVYLLAVPAVVWWLRRRPALIVLVAAPAVALLGPWLAAQAGQGWKALPALFWPAGPLVPLEHAPTWVSPLLPSLLLHPLAALPTLAVCALAAWTFLVSRVGRAAVRWGGAGWAVGLLLAWAAPHVMVGQGAAVAGLVTVHATSHFGASLLLAGALLVVVGGRPALPGRNVGAEAVNLADRRLPRARRLFSPALRPAASRRLSGASMALTLACTAILGFWAHDARQAALGTGDCGEPKQHYPNWVGALSGAVLGSPKDRVTVRDACLRPAPELPVAVASTLGAPHRARLLFVYPGHYPRVALREAPGPLLTDAASHLGSGRLPAADQGEEQVVSAFAGALYGRVSLAQVFSNYGVDGVVVPVDRPVDAAVATEQATPGGWATSAQLAAALDVAPGLRHAARTADAIFWRVGEATAAEGGAVGQISRLRLLSSTGTGPSYERLPMGRTSTSVQVAGAGTLALAEAAPDWRFYADNRPLPTRVEDGLLVADVPPGTHTVQVDYVAGMTAAWWWARMGTLAVVLLAALPLRRARLIGEDE